MQQWKKNSDLVAATPQLSHTGKSGLTASGTFPAIGRIATGSGGGGSVPQAPPGMGTCEGTHTYTA